LEKDLLKRKEAAITADEIYKKRIEVLGNGPISLWVGCQQLPGNVLYRSEKLIKANCS